MDIDWSEIDREIDRHAILGIAVDQEQPHRKRIRRMCEVVAFLLALALMWLALGCQTTLAPEGAYHGDTFLFNADKVLVDSKDDLGGFLGWELANRQVLADHKLQSVTSAADAIRTNAPLWFKLAYDARNNYSNAAALHQPNVAQTSNSLLQAVTTLQAQRLSARAITNSIKLK